MKVNSMKVAAARVKIKRRIRRAGIQVRQDATIPELRQLLELVRTRKEMP